MSQRRLSEPQNWKQDLQIRANDPIYEIGMRLGVIDKTEYNFWHADLKNLAAYFGVDCVVQQTNTLVDPAVQWKYARNIWHNAALRTAI